MSTSIEQQAPPRITVTRAGSEAASSAQSPGAHRISGVSRENTAVSKLWFGKVINEPGFRSTPHDHGVAETGGYILRGDARIYFGEDFQEFVDLHEGDFVFVPANLPHVEANMSTEHDLVWLSTRAPDNIVRNLPDVPDEQLPGFRRT
jgi:uncharacterized RmlC-like cupin family protein